MRPVLVDTNAYVALLRGDAEVAEVFGRADRLYLNAVVLGELLAGFAAGSREAANRLELTRFVESSRVGVVPVTAETADSYALAYASLRRKGQPIPANDLWIPASALEHGLALLSLDAHFAQVDGLRLGRRLADFLP